MHLDAIPRHQLAHLPTALEFLPRISEHLSGPRLWIKRDDCTGLGLGGNKTRKLEYLVGQALADEHDCLITFGALQSNHVRQTAAAAAKVGLECVAILVDLVPYPEAEYRNNGNLLLDDLFGARILQAPDMDAAQQMLTETLATLAGQSRSALVVPTGGSDAIGALGYVSCAHELADDFARLNLQPAAVVHATASGGTQAGLVAGARSLDVDWPVIGINVYRADVKQQHAQILELAQSCASLLDAGLEILPSDIRIEDNAIGQGYGIPTADMREAVKFMAREEGILLDPVYTGKGFAGLLDMIKSGRFRDSDNVVFIHTGGAPGLFAYRSEF